MLSAFQKQQQLDQGIKYNHRMSINGVQIASAQGGGWGWGCNDSDDFYDRRNISL